MMLKYEIRVNNGKNHDKIMIEEEPGTLDGN